MGSMQDILWLLCVQARVGHLDNGMRTEVGLSRFFFKVQVRYHVVISRSIDSCLSHCTLISSCRYGGITQAFL